MQLGMGWTAQVWHLDGSIEGGRFEKERHGSGEIMLVGRDGIYTEGVGGDGIFGIVGLDCLD
jgi:hypothetical protein